MHQIFIDADGCPVKDEVYRVALRYKLPVKVVSNSYLQTPALPLIERVAVSDKFDAADDWIAETAGNGDIVITADIPLAARCLKNGARVLGAKGREFTDDSIGEALASRAIAEERRAMGMQTGGPAPMAGKHRSAFLAKLDEIVNALLRDYPKTESGDQDDER